MSIKGEVTNLEYPYIFASYTAADTLAIDTIHVDEKGRFSYHNAVDTFTVFTLYFNNYNSSAVVFADKGQKLLIKGDAQLPDLIRITGNTINDELTSFKILNEDLLKQRGQLLMNLRERNSNSNSNDSVPNSRSLAVSEEMVQINSLNYELTQKAEDYIGENPEKMSSLILINDFFTNSDNPKALERVLEYIEGDVSHSQVMKRLTAYSEKINRSAEGSPMPYFQLTDKDGKDIRSNSFKGKHLLLSFISSAGIESREAIDVLKSAYSEVDKDSVEFISIYIDSDRFPVVYPETDSIPWIVVPEKKSWGSDIVDTYNIQYVPFNILISPDGMICDRNIPAHEVASTIRKLSAS